MISILWYVFLFLFNAMRCYYASGKATCIYIYRLTSVAFSYVNLFFAMLTRDHAATQTHPVITHCNSF